MKKIALFLLCFCIVVLILSVGCVSSTKVDSTGSVPSKAYVQPTQASTPVRTIASTPVKTISKENLELIESHIETGAYGVRYVVGQVRNNADRTYSYVQVTINLYDNSGAQVGSTLANVNNLEPGGLWKFKAVLIEDTATNYKIKEITGF